MWPECEHGYFITPSHKCPWCFGGDTSKYIPVVGKGNGWLRDATGPGSVPCEGCGGPRGAGWGAWSGPDEPTPERVYEQMLTIRFCYSCTSEGKAMRRTSKAGEMLTTDELKRINNARVCCDCGKCFIVPGICPRQTCGSRFKDGVRVTDAHPDEPPRKMINFP